jgi:thiamine biosynthesis lipoprotein
MLLLHAEDEADARAAAAAAMQEIARIEARYSRYRTGSELSRINGAAKAGASIEVDEETAALIDYAFACYRKSDGLFDISSGLLRHAWDFSSGRLPAGEAIAALLPHVAQSLHLHPGVAPLQHRNAKWDNTAQHLGKTLAKE